MDSTTVTKPAVHAVMTANHVNPKLLTNSCQRRQLRTSGLNPASGLSQGELNRPETVEAEAIGKLHFWLGAGFVAKSLFRVAFKSKLSLWLRVVSTYQGALICC
jgi:hypothetical protein